MQRRSFFWKGLLGSTLLISGCGQTASPLLAPAEIASNVQAAESNATPVIPQALRDEVAVAERLLSKKVSYKSQKTLDAYLGTMVQALPPSAFDPQGFLAALGLREVLSMGKQDAPTLMVVTQLKGYRPKDLVNGHEILPQQMAFDMAMAHPQLFLDLTKVSNPLVEAYAVMKGTWKKPFVVQQKASPTGIPPREAYAGAFAALPVNRLGFNQDFHSGIPPLNEPNKLSYGTYTIARDVGFTDEQAKRVANNCEGIDDNTTPYGHTSYSPVGAIDRHFNLDRHSEDTRLVWAKRHLQAAVTFGKESAYAQAEVELGCGLHSLQDAFAHGQLSPSVHGVIGSYPDDVTYDPIAVIEATDATAAYLRAYLQSL